MSEQLGEQSSRNTKGIPKGSLIIVSLEDGRAFRTSLLEPEEGVAKVWPVEPGQVDTSRPSSLEAISRMGSKVIEGSIRPRILPIEGDEGPVVFGELIPGQELVFQNERNGAGTMTYTGSSIARILIDTSE